jgi:hypothetical protein
MLGCRHLLSHKQNGIEIQTYSAIIACMLIALWAGRKPTKRTFEMICFYFCGLASEDELMAHIEKLKKQTSSFAGCCRHLARQPSCCAHHSQHSTHTPSNFPTYSIAAIAPGRGKLRCDLLMICLLVVDCTTERQRSPSGGRQCRKVKRLRPPPGAMVRPTWA